MRYCSKARVLIPDALQLLSTTWQLCEKHHYHHIADSLHQTIRRERVRKSVLRTQSKPAVMTAYIPSLTLPSHIFESPAASILLPILAGTAIGFSTRPSDTQNTYLALRQPPLRPPPWVFGPAWTTLYGLMGYAAHRAWTTGMSSLDPRKTALTRVSSSLEPTMGSRR